MHAFEDIAGLYREELRSLREDAVRFARAESRHGAPARAGVRYAARSLWLICCWSRSHGLPARVRADAESRLPRWSRTACSGCSIRSSSARFRPWAWRNSSPIRRAWPGCGRIRHSGAHIDPQP